MTICSCLIPSASSHHENCINEGCGKRIETIYEKYDALKAKNKRLELVVETLKELYVYGDSGFYRKQNQSTYSIAPKHDIEMRAVSQMYHANFDGKLAREIKERVSIIEDIY